MINYFLRIAILSLISPTLKAKVADRKTLQTHRGECAAVKRRALRLMRVISPQNGVIPVSHRPDLGADLENSQILPEVLN
jgi:hypothetical protein